jgi:hypothetical protein
MLKDAQEEYLRSSGLKQVRMTEETPIIQLEEGFASDIDKFSVGTLRDRVREEDLRGHGGER